MRLLLALLLGLLPASLSAQEVTPTEITLPQVVLPSSDAIKQRTFVQLAWNAELGRLDRVRVSVVDPLASLDLTLSWKTDAQVIDAGALTGEGKLSWTQPGTRPYDPAGRVAYYEGAVEAGRFEGQGRYWHRSGTVYEGKWTAGLMEGTGILQFGDGRSYQGGFKAGWFHGQGTLNARDGSMISGRFEAGILQGRAELTHRDGVRFATYWRDGKEDLTKRQRLDGQAFEPRLAQGAVYNDVSLLVSVDLRLPPAQQGDRSFFVEYQSRLENGALVVFPDSDEFMARWRGPGQLEKTQFGFFNFFTEANFLMSFENRGVQPVEIIGGYLNVSASQQDLDPYISHNEQLDCGEQTLTKIYLTNWGWAQPQNASIEGGLISRDGSRIVVPLNVPNVGGWPNPELDFAQALSQSDPVLASLAVQPVVCPTSDQEACLEQGKASGAFGAIGDTLYLGLNGAVNADYYGVLSYDWTDRTGAVQRKGSPLRAKLKVGTLVAASECGEGSDFDSPFPAPFKLPFESAAYRYPFLLNGRINPGTIANWNFQIDSDKSSRHLFDVVLQLSDGREVRSGPIDLTYFKRADPYAIR